MPKLKINGIEVEVAAGATVLQACQLAGVEVPHFCFHERLAIAGNCRMCLVEQEKAPKPIASCAMPVADGMVILTDSEKAKKARKGVMEFLLINHPLDCPICDQGGECDLQDQAMAYGFDRGRYQENKRAVKDKDFGPLVETSMNRCIHCTRCIRFLGDVAGVADLGGIGRGEDMEIDTFVGKALESELSANIIDLCPVGALTSKPYAFAARPWELRKTESVDVLDAVGSNIRVDARGPAVLRILPRLNEEVNEEWISDKARFAVDALTRRRLDRPFVRRAGKLVEATWPEAFALIATRLKGSSGSRIAAIAGDLADSEAMFALKELMTALGSPHLDCRQDGAALDPSCRAGYLFNTTIAGIEQSDACVLIGTNPRYEAALINARLRKRWLQGGFKLGAFGPALDLTFPVTTLGTGSQGLVERARTFLGDAKNPMLILGQGALRRKDGAAILALARELAESAGMVREGWNGFNVLHLAASRVGGLDLGFVPGQGGLDLAGILAGAERGEIDLVYLLGADEIDTARLGSAFVIYQGHHGDRGAARADVVLPGAAYTEKDACYVNTEGRVQLARRAVFPPGEAREDWAILRALSAALGKPLPYDSLAELRARLMQAHPSFGAIDHAPHAAWGAFGKAGAVDDAPFVYPIRDFFRTDMISRASPIMAECAAARAENEALKAGATKTGTHG
ncbi:MAG TPA: NADH-quinone oxidoreductase subunit NuoG [Stellaceae bacterium]|jgi:NADH-quinone oxidoreductase subunit G|nr:NADH-quinone oxidoreductase subunit NuoG [Stellaceae bacterium]